MTRTRWAALLALILLALGAGVAAMDEVGSQPPRISSATADNGSDPLATGPEGPGPALTAVEPGRPMVGVRSESRQGSWAVTFALAAVGLLLAPGGRRRLRLRGLLELAIRARSEWWRPAPGRRAPPGLSAP